MDKRKRKPFFIKGNFQIAFILFFILLLFAEVTAGGFLIYRLSARALEEAAFSSHLVIDRSAQIIRPVIIRVNACIILISVFLAACAVAITYFRLHSLFTKIIRGLENLKNNNASLRISWRGSSKKRELVREFNYAASCLDKRIGDLRLTLDSLLAEKEIDHIKKLHARLYSILTGAPRG